MDTRAETTEALINWIRRQHNYFKNNGGYTANIVKTDNGSEFVNKKFKSFCQSHGIEHNTSNPYEPCMNGRIERLNRSLKEIASAVLATSGLPRVYYWKYAISFAKICINQIAINTDGTKMSPMQAYYGLIPSYKDLLPFGCKVYIPNRNNNFPTHSGNSRNISRLRSQNVKRKHRENHSNWCETLRINTLPASVI